MLINEIINKHVLAESVSSIIYHQTGMFAAHKILSEKRFRLSTSFGTSSEKQLTKGDDYYYLSTTRSKMGDYTLHNVYNDGVVFKLNGEWFNRHYKGGPVDYWEGYWIKQRQAGSMDRFSEMEDRIFSDEPYIYYGNNTILETHVLINNKTITKNNILRIIITECLKQRIKIFIYDDRKDFFIQNKKKSISIMDVIKKFQSHKKENSYQRIPKDYLSPWKELHYKKSKEELSSDARKKLDILLRYEIDAIRGIENDIHNMRTTDVIPVKNFLKIMRKNKFKSVKEFVLHLQNKWNKLY